MIGLMGKASMVGFTLVSRSYYYLRRRSPGPPFPPDHRQAGERGAIIAKTTRRARGRENTRHTPLLARHEPVVSGSHFDECFGRLRMTLLVRVKPYRKDPKPSANGLSRMS